MNFGFGQQPQQFQTGQQFQMGQQLSQVNYAEMQRKQNQIAQLQHVKSVLNRVYELQNQPEFQGLIQLLTLQQNVANQQLKKTMDQSDIKTVNPAQIESLYRRGQRIKEKNSVLTNKLLLVKSKLERLMYQNANPHSKYEYETSLAMDKIRTLKSEITQKCAYLKTLKFNKSNEFVQQKNQQKQGTFSSLGTALTELKNGTEILEREVLKQKTEMQILSKYVNQAN